jgi:hypothetical protein
MGVGAIAAFITLVLFIRSITTRSTP